MKIQLKHLFETVTGIQVFRNSLPRGVDVCRDITRIYNYELDEIWDIGAHMGETASYFRSKFAKPTIRSFEPIAENFRILQKRCAEISDHHSYQLALGDEVKPTRIYLQDASVIHSLRSDLNIPSTNNSNTEEINQTTVDSLFNKLNCHKIDVLKIDVEGYEKNVLKGAESCLEQKLINFIYLETGLDTRFNSIQELIDCLHPVGYMPYAFYEQTPHWTGKQNLWYWNTLFVKEELL